jgi:NCS1 family nucleobase:cation symporter-1
VSYGLFGLVGVTGKRAGAPGMAPSRAAFGQRGNLLPGSLIWLARWGWETINTVTGAYALLTVLAILFGIRSNTWATHLFGASSVLVLAHLIVETH